VDSCRNAALRRIRSVAHVLFWPNRYQFEKGSKKIGEVAEVSGTLGASQVLENKRLPQKVLLCKHAEGDHPIPITLCDQNRQKCHQGC
jgi:hypothetical protein